MYRQWMIKVVTVAQPAYFIGSSSVTLFNYIIIYPNVIVNIRNVLSNTALTLILLKEIKQYEQTLSVKVWPLFHIHADPKRHLYIGLEEYDGIEIRKS